MSGLLPGVVKDSAIGIPLIEERHNIKYALKSCNKKLKALVNADKILLNLLFNVTKGLLLG
jgi:hypothetical protein